MIHRLILLVSLLSVVIAGPLCPDDDGLYPNKDDRTTYIECIDGQERFHRCPRTADGRSYQVFNGRICVEPVNAFVCPQPSGSYRFISDDKQFYECIDNIPVLRQCPENTVFDGLTCSPPKGPVSESVVVSTEFTCPRQSGVFSNPLDQNAYTYYECYNGVPTKRSCPAFTASNERGYYQDRMVFNGHNCVRPANGLLYPRKPVYDDPRGPVRRQADYRCTISDGIQQSQDINTWYECVAGEAVRIITCEPGQTLDITSRRCRGTTVRDEEVIIHKPETVVVESDPRVVELARQGTARDPPVREGYYPGGYYGRRYRRNGRVELEDQYTGAVIVDTWNEGAWRWDRNVNGQRLPLPLVNEWVDYGWRRGYEAPVAEYRGRPVEQVYRPNQANRYPY